MPMGIGRRPTCFSVAADTASTPKLIARNPAACMIGQQLFVEPVEPRFALEAVCEPPRTHAVAEGEHAIAVLRKERIAEHDVHRAAQVVEIRQFVEDVGDRP